MKSKGIKLTLKDEGYDIYAPREGQTWGYRYGPSIMCYDGKRADAWFASPGARGEADWFTYRHTEDGGKTWTPEKVVLTPTADSMDLFSVCDPGVIKFGGYYYIGYTSTVFTDFGGVCNNGYVARSKNPDGPFEKWTGSGWGEERVNGKGERFVWMGKPAPIIYFEGDWHDWGEGEFSFVVSNDVLYIYYTLTTNNAAGEHISETRVATADATDENWPNTIRQRGVAAKRTSTGNDSFDVVYSDECSKFIAISTDKRFKKESVLAIYESDTGLRFKRVNELRTNVSQMCHNSGISGDELHHVKKGDLKLLGYAYGDKWGFWGTRFHEYSISKNVGFYSEADLPCVERTVDAWPRKDLTPISVMPLTDPKTPRFYKTRMGEQFELSFGTFDSTYACTETKDVEISGYDSEIVEINGLTVTPKRVGYTFATVSCSGVYSEFLIYVYPENFDFSNENKFPVSMEPTVPEYRISLNRNEKKQIRAIIQYSNGTWEESGHDHSYLSYGSDDPEICKIREDGVIVTNGVCGKTYATMRYGDLEARFRIVVTKM